MAIRLKIPKSEHGGKTGKGRFSRDPVIRAAVLGFVAVAIAVVGSFSYFYVKYDRIIERRFSTSVFSNSAKIYAIPQVVRVGQPLEAKEIAARLRRAGYSDQDGASPLGSYRLLKDGIEITPGPESYHSPESARITIQDGQVQSITSKGNQLAAYELEPQLITALFDAERAARHEI